MFLYFLSGTYELPQFSSPALAKKFALSEHLDYIYYLQKGQPSFAFANFVAARLVNHSNTRKRCVDRCLTSTFLLPSSCFHCSNRINRLMSRVYRLAMGDFSNLRLGASCAALMEMLGRDSTSFRVDLQCANRIAKYTSGILDKGIHSRF